MSLGDSPRTLDTTLTYDNIHPNFDGDTLLSETFKPIIESKIAETANNRGGSYLVSDA